MTLDCDEGTLEVHVNGGRGVMVRPGMRNHRGEPVSMLKGPLRWAVDVYAGAPASAVTIRSWSEAPVMP